MFIVLIGPRGCGKSTIGPLLASHFGCEFIDLDDRAAAKFEEPTITAIWAAHSETAWRSAERDALEEVLGSSAAGLAAREAALVLSLGGGATTNSEVRTLLASHKPNNVQIIYLKCPVDVLVQRLTDVPGDRPALTRDTCIAEEIGAIVARREPIYHSLADRCIAASAPPEEVAAAIAHEINATK